MKRTVLLALAAIVCLCASPAGAYIERMYPLADVLKESDFILVGKIESIDPKAKTAVASLDRVIKGDANHWPTLRMNLGTAPAHHTEFLMKQLRVDTPIMFFYRNEGLVGIAHCGDLYFQLYGPGQRQPPERAWWRMSHVEVGMGRTFNGPTADFIKLVADVQGGKLKPPDPDPNVPRLDIDRIARAVAVTVPAGKQGLHRQVAFAHDGGGEIRGVSLTDVNGDGLTDLFFCRQNGNLLLIAQKETFQDWTSRAGLTGGARGAAWADYDGDGKPDLVTANFQLLTNANPTFRDSSALLKVPDDKDCQSAGWIDFDGDGLPDILVANGQYGLRLWRNTGKSDARFADVSDKAGLGPKGLAVGRANYFTLLDYDGDGWTDILYNTDVPVMLHNTRTGAFAIDSKAVVKFDGPPETIRGVAVGDYDNDDDVDLFIPGPRPVLMRNNNDGTFTDVTAASGLSKLPDNSFSAAWGDVNGDGNLDLVVCRPAGGTRLMLGDGHGHFTEAGEALGVTQVRNVSAAAFADIDGDGDEDLILSLADKVVLAYNDLPRPNDRGPVIVAPHVSRGLTGAVVRAWDERGRHLARRDLSGSDGCGGQPCPAPALSLPLGKCFVSVCLSDGRAAIKPVTVTAKVQKLVFAEEDFD